MKTEMSLEKPSVPSNRSKRRPIGIALRIALLSWIVAMCTLLIFVMVTIPQQKRIFLRNLESKANGVAVSLHDTAAGAAINEDFASVVTATETMIKGDPDIDFLIVMKNDGFSLVIEQTGWRAESAIGEYWLPPERAPAGAIATVPRFDRRVFHFAQPFDYSGIQWGWIHVGLSLEDYERNVAALYLNTLLLALGCVAFSLLSSLAYARRLVRPILRLRQVVRQIAGGDFSVRADWVRRDEFGSLAASVNTMTEALMRRDRILESIRFAAQQFMHASQWENAIDPIMEKIGEAAGSSRAYIFANQKDDSGRLCCSIRHEWTAPGISGQLHNQNLQYFPYATFGFERWKESLGSNEILVGRVSEMSESERAVLEPQNILSLVVIPIYAEGEWWGFLGLDDCDRDRVWSDAEVDSLRAGADMLGATIARQRAQDALLEAKETLEERVEERTLELRKQVVAKEHALAELAAAQSSLLEASRAAGMAEVATGVLHNVGNVLNSVNVSCTLLMEQLRQSRVGNLSRIAEMMKEPEGGLARFLSEDPRGRQIPAYLAALSVALEEERRAIFKESESLRERIDHIKEIVAMQQNYGCVFGVNETIPPERLMEDALKIFADSLARHGITVERRYEAVPPIAADKHKVLQILLNLINNAKYACIEAGEDKTVTLRVLGNGPGRVLMQVEDNGTGIPAANLTRIFRHGFTTRKSGHGFGLHSGALAARELNGSLSVCSDGPGSGATFTLELPCLGGNAMEPDEIG